MSDKKGNLFVTHRFFFLAILVFVLAYQFQIQTDLKFIGHFGIGMALKF